MRENLEESAYFISYLHMGSYAVVSIFKSFDKTVITKMIAEMLVFMFLKLFCLIVFKESSVCF